MKILGFDTATAATTVALAGTGESVLEARDDPVPGSRPNHTARLLALIDEVLEQAGIDFAALDRIAVGVGPGTFTGLRIGIATAQALARAADVELVGVSTLHALAIGALDAGAPVTESVLAVLDARRGEVFAAGWRRASLEHEADAWLAPRALSPLVIADWLGAAAAGTLAIGDGAVAFRDALERCGALVPQDQSPLHKVTAAAHCRIALGLRADGAEAVLPRYLREPDATEPALVRGRGAR